MSEQTIKLELTISEVNLVLEALGEQPFKEVFALVARLQAQARSQLGEVANSTSPTPSQQHSDDATDASPVP